ncbi:MAG: nucleotidyltransferase domain-containing protein [Candidatus Micrarchaeota archaeon]
MHNEVNSKSIVKKLSEQLRRLKSVKAAILFGSVAKGKERKNSDIDICAITTSEDDSPLDLSSDKLDISLFHKLPLVVRYHVFRDGQLLFSKDDKLLTKLKFWTIKHYLDEKHWRDRFVEKVLSC